MVVCWSNKKEKKVIMLFEFDEIFNLKAICDLFINLCPGYIDDNLSLINSYDSLCNCLEVVPYDKK